MSRELPSIFYVRVWVIHSNYIFKHYLKAADPPERPLETMTKKKQTSHLSVKFFRYSIIASISYQYETFSKCTHYFHPLSCSESPETSGRKENEDGAVKETEAESKYLGKESSPLALHLYIFHDEGKRREKVTQKELKCARQSFRVPLWANERICEAKRLCFTRNSVLGQKLTLQPKLRSPHKHFLKKKLSV